MEDPDEPREESSPIEEEQPTRNRSMIRPHSAKGKKPPSSSSASSTPEPPIGRFRRPWSAHPKTRAEVSKKKLVRDNLKKSHMRPPNRRPKSREVETPVEEKEADDTQVLGLECPGLDYKPHRYKVRGQDLEGPDEDTLDHGVTTLVSESSGRPVSPDHSWALTQGKNDPSKTRKQHPSFETWIMPSPHDSEDYDTDLETDMLKKADKPIDPTGKTTYLDQCKRDGLIPVSYLSRHLGDRNLRMRHHYLGGLATKPVARALEFNTVTENLDLGDNYLEGDGAAYLCRMLKDNMFIVSLDISNNFIQSRGAKAIANMLEVNTTLKTLSLSGNQLCDRDANYFMEALKNNTSLTSLDLSNNEFGETGGLYIAGALVGNESITDLDLSWNSLRNKGAEAIGKALANNQVLEVLDVSWNGFGMPGCRGLQLGLRVNSKLRVLDISNNRINKNCAKELSLGLSKNFGLETLLMNLNALTDEGIETILKAASQNQTLTYLSLQSCGEMNINISNYKRIQQMENEKDITILHGGLGGAQRYTPQTSVLKVLSKFLKEHRIDLEGALRQQDKDHSGTLQHEEVKLALKEAGLRLTNKQIDILVEELDVTHSGSIKWEDILSGRVLTEYNRRKSSNAYKVAEVDQETLFSNMKRRQLTVI
uniref:Leucine-rich repeat-containing protein 74A-like isoform X1 n=1 Tax=Crassostrea virginica TaxID=6565 RepID=A0A8B8B6Y4_CRAVI|nr:leucine-rich repeat-containing protein 74A-like isoform X1 [Crassostrea virginica]XP_022298886.1 leucine-rich repeat-containing protein 74A-like isoform X1 [Crassostrea virginica]